MEKEIKSKPKNDEPKNDRIYLLNKIKHKPVILESTMSFSSKRLYILIHMISNDKILKERMKKVFDNSKHFNDLSKELNININQYITYRQYYEKLTNIYNNFFNPKKNIYEVIKKKQYYLYSLPKNYFKSGFKITISFSKTLKESYPELYKELNDKLSKNFLNEKLNNFQSRNEIELGLELIILVNGEFNDDYDTLKFDFCFYFRATKIYRKICKKRVEKKILEECSEGDTKYKEVSNMEKMSSQVTTKKEKNSYQLQENTDIHRFVVDFISGRDKFILYNLPYENNLDKKYLNYLTKNNLNQKIELICIIDRFNYSQYIESIT